MLPIRWDPIRNLSTIHGEIDDLFSRTFGLSRGEEDVVFSPMVNAYTKGNEFCVEAEIPGVDKNDLDVSVEGDMLVLRGERKVSKETKEEEFLIRESQYGSFIRRLTLPQGVKLENIHASYDNGILRITMPVEGKSLAGHKIQIEGAGKEGKLEGGHKVKQVH